MTRDELKKHCEQAVLYQDRRADEHKLVLEIMKEHDLQVRALTAIRDFLFAGDDMSALAQQVLDGNDDLLKKAESRHEAGEDL